MPRFEDLAGEGQALVEVGGEVVGVDVATQAELTAATTGLATETYVDTAVANATSLLASKVYDPVGLVVQSTTSDTLVDVDATNLTVTFTAPASGTVLASCEALGDASDVNGGFGLGLRDASGIVAGAGNGCRIAICAIAYQQLRGRATFKVSGLTPGNSYTWRMAFRRENGIGTGRVLYGDGYTAVMEVWSANP